MNERVEQKLDKLDTRLDKVDIHLERYNILLEQHMKRTELLEEATKPVIEDHRIFRGIVRWSGAGFGALATIAGLIVAIGKIFGLF